MFKKIDWKDPYIKVAVLVFLVIAALLVFYNILGTVGEIALRVRSFISTIASASSAIIIGIIIAFVLRPYVSMLDDKLISKVIKKNKIASCAVSIFIVYIVVIGFVVLLIALITPVLVINIKDIVSKAPRYVDAIVAFINEDILETSLFQNADVIATINSLVNDLKANITKMASGIFSNTVRFITSFSSGTVNMVFGFIMAFYILMERRRLELGGRRLLVAVVGDQKTKKIAAEVKIAADIFQKFFNGRIIESFLTGLLMFIALSIVGVKYSALIGVLTFIANLIPYFGPIICSVFTFLLVALENPSQLLIAMILMIAVNIIDSWVLSPKILGDVVGLSPFWVLLGALVGGGLFGFWGMMIGIPSASVIHFAASRWVDYRISKRRKDSAKQKKSVDT